MSLPLARLLHNSTNFLTLLAANNALSLCINFVYEAELFGTLLKSFLVGEFYADF